jgi:gliding motility-associated-like protein
MKRLLQIFLIIVSTLVVKDIRASHMMGADMSYQCLGNGKYKITAKVYRDCRGIPMGIVSFSAFAGLSGSNGCGTVSPGGLTRTGIRDVTTRCSSANSPCNPKNTGGTGKGVEEHTFEATVDFSKSPLSGFVNKSTCCEVTFYVNECCRNGNITTGPAGNDFFSTCMINICNLKKCLNKCNSSPSLTNDPVGFLCCNIPWYYNNGALDTVDYDSISYRLVYGLNGVPASTVSYSSPFTYVYPMTPFCVPPTTIKCTPNPSTNPPRGFYFDTANGDIIVTPTKCDEVPIIVIEQTEWRADSASGKYIVVGRTRRDMQMWVLDDCGYNKPPVINGPFSWIICEGDKICKKIKITDETFTPYQTTPDTVIAKWNGGIPGATFTVVDKTKREKEYEFCWQTKRGQASEVSYSFTVAATDQHCTPPVISIRSFKVKVQPRAEDERIYTTVDKGVLKGYTGASLASGKLKCGRFSFAAKLAANFKGNATYQWSVRDSTGKKELYFSAKKTDTITVTKGGKFIIVHTVNNTFNCPTIFRDTVILPEPPKVVLATKDTFACKNTTMKILPKVSNGKPNYSYYWTRISIDTAKKIWKNEYHISGDTLDYLTIPGINRDSTIRIKVKDGDGCIFYDTATIFLKPLPVIGLGPDQRICTYEKATFDAQNNDSVKYLWNTGDTTQKITKNVKGDYIVKVMEKRFKCIMYDTAKLFVNDTVTAIAGPDLTMCHLQSILINGQHRNAALSAVYSWKDVTKNTILGSNTSYTVSPKNTNTPGGLAQFFTYSLYVTVKQGNHTCEDYDTMVLKVNTLPFVKWDPKPLKAQCFAYGDIEMNSFFNRGKISGVRIWSGKRFAADVYIDSVNPTRHMFKTTKLNNATQLQNGKNFVDNIYGWYKDTNGCVNVDSVTQRINGNPILELTNKTYCQDKGDAFMDSSVIKPKTKAGVNFLWTPQLMPNGVDSAKILVNNNPLGTPDWHFLFGSPTEDFYMGTYKFKLCIEDILTKCKSCDTTITKIIGEPTIKIISPNPLCVNWDTIDLYDNVLVNSVKGADGDGGSFKIVEFDYAKTGPMIGKALPLGHLFPPSFGRGNYKILYSNNGTGCLKTDSFYITVNDTPDAVLLTNVTLCSSGPKLDLNTRIDYVKSKPSGATINWVGPNLAGTMFTPVTTKTANIEGPYKMTMSYTDNNGCADTETYSILVRTQPEINISSTKPMSACENTPLAIQSKSAFSNSQVFWTLRNGSDGKIDNINSENINYLNGLNDIANKSARLLVTTVPLANDVCPPVFDSIDIVYYLYPKLDPIAMQKGCVPLITNWSVTDSKGINPSDLAYSWIFSNGDSSKLATPTNINFNVQGNYFLNVIVTNTKGPCADTMSSTIEAYPIPDAKFRTDPKYHTTVALPKFIMYNESSVQQNPFNPTMGYVWDFGTSKPDTSMIQSPRFAYSRDTGVYHIKLLVTTNHGCTDTASQWIHIGPDIIVFVPDVFTPNSEGPGFNETFAPVATNFKSISMAIYNRWGERLYETNDITKGWNGMANGQNCMQDVYVYHIIVTSFEDKEYIYDGTVTLLR